MPMISPCPSRRWQFVNGSEVRGPPSGGSSGGTTPSFITSAAHWASPGPTAGQAACARCFACHSGIGCPATALCLAVAGKLVFPPELQPAIASVAGSVQSATAQRTPSSLRRALRAVRVQTPETVLKADNAALPLELRRDDRLIESDKMVSSTSSSAISSLAQTVVAISSVPPPSRTDKRSKMRCSWGESKP